MGTTAEKGARVLQSIAEVQEGINNLGGNLTDQTPFKDFKAQLDEIYNNLPKTEYQEGTEVNLGKTIKGKLDYDNGVVGIGQTEQNSTTGKNKFEPSLFIDTTNITASRCDVVLDDDEYIMTCTGQDMYFGEVTSAGISYIKNRGVKVNVEGQSQIYVYLTNTALVSNFITAYNSQNVSLGFTGLGSYKGVYNIPEGTSYITLRFGLASSTSGQVYRTKVMITYGGTEDTNYEKYSGGYASPSPNWKQQIKSVKGVNLAKSKVVSGTTAGYADVLLCEADLQPLTTYAISFEGIENNKLYCNELLFDLHYFTVGSGRTTLITRTKPTISKSNASQYRQGGWLIFKNNGSGNPTANIFDNLQIEEGSTPHPYTPYNTIEVGVRGKNLLDFSSWVRTLMNKSPNITDGSIDSYTDNSITITASGNDCFTASYTLSNNASANKTFCETYPSLVQEVKGNTKYTFSFERSNTSIISRPAFFFLDKDYNYLGLDDQDRTAVSSVTLTTPSNAKYMTFRVGIYHSNGSTLTISNLMIEENPTATDYEPYITPTSYQLSLGDIELNAIGNYKDELIYDVDEDKVYKNEKIGRNDFDENSSWEDLSSYWGQGSFAVRLAVIGNDKIAWSKMYCKYFIAYTNSQTKNLNNEMVVGSSSIVFNNSNISTLAEWRTWVTTHHFSVYYPKSTPTQIPITDTTLINQVKALYNAHSNNGTTIITSNGDLPMIIKVRGLKGE